MLEWNTQCSYVDICIFIFAINVPFLFDLFVNFLVF